MLYKHNNFSLSRVQYFKWHSSFNIKNTATLSLNGIEALTPDPGICEKNFIARCMYTEKAHRTRFTAQTVEQKVLNFFKIGIQHICAQFCLFLYRPSLHHNNTLCRYLLLSVHKNISPNNGIFMLCVCSCLMSCRCRLPKVTKILLLYHHHRRGLTTNVL